MEDTSSISYKDQRLKNKMQGKEGNRNEIQLQQKTHKRSKRRVIRFNEEATKVNHDYDDDYLTAISDEDDILAGIQS